MSRSVKTAEENNTLNVREARSNLYNQNVVCFWQRGIIIDYVIVFNFIDIWFGHWKTIIATSKQCHHVGMSYNGIVR